MLKLYMGVYLIFVFVCFSLYAMDETAVASNDTFKILVPDNTMPNEYFAVSISHHYLHFFKDEFIQRINDHSIELNAQDLAAIIPSILHKQDKKNYVTQHILLVLKGCIALFHDQQPSAISKLFSGISSQDLAVIVPLINYLFKPQYGNAIYQGVAKVSFDYNKNEYYFYPLHDLHYCETINNMLQDLSSDQKEISEIPLHNTTKESFDFILKLFAYGKKQDASFVDSFNIVQRTALIDQIKNLSHETMCSLMNAMNYLDVPKVLLKYIATWYAIGLKNAINTITDEDKKWLQQLNPDIVRVYINPVFTDVIIDEYKGNHIKTGDCIKSVDFANNNLPRLNLPNKEFIWPSKKGADIIFLDQHNQMYDLSVQAKNLELILSGSGRKPYKKTNPLPVFNDSGTLLATEDALGIGIYNVQKKEYRVCPFADVDNVKACAFSKDNTYVAVLYEKSPARSLYVVIFDCSASYNKIYDHQINIPSDTNTTVQDSSSQFFLSFHPDDSEMLLLAFGKHIWCLYPSTDLYGTLNAPGARFGQLKYQPIDEILYGIDFSNDGTCLQCITSAANKPGFYYQEYAIGDAGDLVVIENSRLFFSLPTIKKVNAKKNNKYQYASENQLFPTQDWYVFLKDRSTYAIIVFGQNNVDNTGIPLSFIYMHQRHNSKPPEDCVIADLLVQWYLKGNTLFFSNVDINISNISMQSLCKITQRSSSIQDRTRNRLFNTVAGQIIVPFFFLLEDTEHLWYNQKPNQLCCVRLYDDGLIQQCKYLKNIADCSVLLGIYKDYTDVQDQQGVDALVAAIVPKKVSATAPDALIKRTTYKKVYENWKNVKPWLHAAAKKVFMQKQYVDRQPVPVPIEDGLPSAVRSGRARMASTSDSVSNSVQAQPSAQQAQVVPRGGSQQFPLVRVASTPPVGQTATTGFMARLKSGVNRYVVVPVLRIFTRAATALFSGVNYIFGL